MMADPEKGETKVTLRLPLVPAIEINRVFQHGVIPGTGRHKHVSYVGLDVSLKSTSICVVDATGLIVIERSVPSEPDAITDFINAKATEVQRVGLESGPTSVWLWRELA